MRKITLVSFVLVFFACAIGFFFPEFYKKTGQEIGFLPTTIGIQPYGMVESDEIDSVKIAIERMYSREVVILPTIDLPKMAYTEIRYPRYRADSLLQWTAEHKPDSIAVVVGLTNQDISITKYKEGTRIIKEPSWMYKDFGIFGLGQVGGSACVVSSNRLHKGVSDKTFFIRLNRIACHEVGHVLGLHHCPTESCLMNDANESIKTIDKSTGILCESCARKIN